MAGPAASSAAPNLFRFVPKRVIRRRLIGVIGAGSPVSPDTVCTMRLESAGIGWRTPSRLLPRKAAAASSGRVHRVHRAHAAPAAFALDTRIDLSACGLESTAMDDADLQQAAQGDPLGATGRCRTRRTIREADGQQGPPG